VSLPLPDHQQTLKVPMAVTLIVNVMDVSVPDEAVDEYSDAVLESPHEFVFGIALILLETDIDTPETVTLQVVSTVQVNDCDGAAPTTANNTTEVVEPPVFDAVNVYMVDADEEVGVPLSTPAAESVRPAGSEGETE
jgi:hypothetical protein